MTKISLILKAFLVFFFVALVNFVLAKFILTEFFQDNPITLLIIGSISFLVVGLILAGSTRSNLNHLRQVLDDLAKTNLEKKIEPQGDGEFGEFNKALEEFRSNLRDKMVAAEESKDRVEAILFNVADGVFAVNLQSEIIIFNQVAEQLVGLKRDQVIGQRYNQLLQFYDSRTNTPYGPFIDKVLLEGRSVTLPKETLLITANQNRVPVAVNTSPVRNQKGIIIGGIVVFRDTSREKELEEIRNDLISIASHQLRTPLSEIKGLLELLVDNVAGPLNDKQKEYLNLLKTANERMINLVNDLLNISRIEQGRIQFQPRVFDLGILAKEVFESFRIPATKRSQNIYYSQDNNPHLVWADPEKTKEIVSNLIENALKYTFEGGTIQIRVTRDHQGVWFLTKDSGVGIPKERQKELFQKFSRVENPLSRITSGTGLGLYTVKQLVERQNGKVFFESEEGKGSTFAILLPIAKTS